jgi:predicted alpha/beta hydrolase family esterase
MLLRPRFQLKCFRIVLGVMLAVGSLAASAAPPATPPATRPYLLHLPGVSGESFVDHTLVEGFKEAHLNAEVEIYDWTEHDTGVPALQAIGRNKKQAKLIAEKLTARFRANPNNPIYLISHSGGAGLAAWALEDLPPDVKIKRAVFLAPALSPYYDLSKALDHISEKAYVYHSDGDTLVLSVGTKTFGTIDGLYVEAAGVKGFIAPPKADAKQYAKLSQIPYDPAWAKYGHGGDHIGPMATGFSRAVIAPVIEGQTPTTLPAKGERS